MAKTTRKCWLTFEGVCKDQPCVWKMSRQFPQVQFDIRQASVGQKIGIMAIQFDGEEAEVTAAVEFLKSMGVRIDPVEGGSLVET
ncbi:MAG: NIL domain-containing protein [Phycisphaeraceae bacterium]|nr:NIL domain-containing protein [Phycisphaeraceae bacterium]